MLKQTLIFVAILTIPFLWIPLMMSFEKFNQELGTISPPKSLVSAVAVGRVLETEHGIPIYAREAETNQNLVENRSEDGYFYGNRWQCTEFVRRYYYDKYGFKMPDELNLAKSYFDPAIAEGEINPKPGLIQYKNGSANKPMPGDLMVFTEGVCGHIAVVSQVKDDSVEIVQQNSVDGKARETLGLVKQPDGWQVQGKTPPAAWLRLPSAYASL